MHEDSNYFIWNKGDVYFLDKEKYFKTSEFACHCNFKDCVEQRISKSLITKISKVRSDIAEPIVITSGFRCSKYQEKLRNEGVNTVVAKKSTHELGQAVDFYPIRMKIPQFLVFVDKYFNSIGIAKTFLHADLRGQDDKKERRWNY